jgi:hypothetical protein
MMLASFVALLVVTGVAFATGLGCLVVVAPSLDMCDDQRQPIHFKGSTREWEEAVAAEVERRDFTLEDFSQAWEYPRAGQHVKVGVDPGGEGQAAVAYLREHGEGWKLWLSDQGGTTFNADGSLSSWEETTDYTDGSVTSRYIERPPRRAVGFLVARLLWRGKNGERVGGLLRWALDQCPRAEQQLRQRVSTSRHGSRKA